MKAYPVADEVGARLAMSENDQRFTTLPPTR